MTANAPRRNIKWHWNYKIGPTLKSYNCDYSFEVSIMFCGFLKWYSNILYINSYLYAVVPLLVQISKSMLEDSIMSSSSLTSYLVKNNWHTAELKFQITIFLLLETSQPIGNVIIPTFWYNWLTYYRLLQVKILSCKGDYSQICELYNNI